MAGTATALKAAMAATGGDLAAGAAAREAVTGRAIRERHHQRSAAGCDGPTPAKTLLGPTARSAVAAPNWKPGRSMAVVAGHTLADSAPVPL